jgi:hypothetical protein
MYDIYYVSKNKTDDFAQLKQKFPLIKHARSFQEAQERCLTEFFWIVWDDLTVDNTFEFSYIPDDWSKNYIHVFLNNDLYDGIILCPKNMLVSKKEIDYRFFINKKEVPVVASGHKTKDYDTVFISYQEPNADENYSKLLKKCPLAKRVHGVKGIHQAHIAAANLCNTDMFWIVDGDAVLVDNFNFKYQVAQWDFETVHVWRSQNPVNDLVYGYGGIKLFPRQLTINMDVSKPDMTTSISNKFKAVQEISNITAFNTDPYNTWKSAFRECAKLSSRIIDRQKDDETQRRLQTWCTVGKDRPYGKYALDGAKMGALYGARNQNSKEKLKMINDFEWLKEQFDARNI